MIKKLSLTIILLLIAIFSFKLIVPNKKYSWNDLAQEKIKEVDLNPLYFNPETDISSNIDFRQTVKSDGKVIYRLYNRAPKEVRFREDILWLILGLRAQEKLKNTSLDKTQLTEIEEFLISATELKSIENEEEYFYLDSLLETNLFKNKSDILKNTLKIIQSEPKSDQDIINQAFLIRSYVLNKNISKQEKIKNFPRLVNATKRNSKISQKPSFTNPKQPGTLICWDLFQTTALLKLDKHNKRLGAHYQESLSTMQDYLREKPYYFVNLKNILPCMQAIIDHDGPKKFAKSKFISAIFNNYLIYLLDFKSDGKCMGSNYFLSYPRVIYSKRCSRNEINYGYNAWLLNILSQLQDAKISISSRVAYRIGLKSFLEQDSLKTNDKESPSTNDNQASTGESKIKSKNELFIENLDVLINGDNKKR